MEFQIPPLKKESKEDHEKFLLYLSSENLNIREVYIEWCKNNNEFYDEDELTKWHYIAIKNDWNNRAFEFKIRQDDIDELELLNRFKQDMLLVTFQARQQAMKNMTNNQKILNDFYNSINNGNLDTQALKTLSSVYNESVKNIQTNFDLSSEVLGLKTVIEGFINNQQLDDVSNDGILEASIQEENSEGISTDKND